MATSSAVAPPPITRAPSPCSSVLSTLCTAAGSAHSEAATAVAVSVVLLLLLLLLLVLLSVQLAAGSSA
jgi:hypothetical protein